jgi:two-component system nitrate/nitrite response regulator NarL
MRALVISDVRFYREGIARALVDDGVEAVVADQGAASLGRQARDADVALVDLVDGAFARSLEAISGEAPVVGLALTPTSSVAAAAALGVRAFVGCDQTLPELVQTTWRASRGEAVCPPSVAATLFASLGRPEPPRPGPIDALTAREREIARLLMRGLSNKEIASALVIEPATVKNHVHQILRKLAIRRRGQAVAVLGAAWTERPMPGDRPGRTGAVAG